MQLVDTHCHIHEILGLDGSGNGVPEKWHKAGVYDADKVLEIAKQAGVNRLICVGCTLADSALACAFAASRTGVWASIGIHPHEAKDHVSQETLRDFAKLLHPKDRGRAAVPRSAAAAATGPQEGKIVAIGECGLDFYYTHSPKKEQERILRFQIELALQHNLPMIFHVRDAFKEFWPIFDEYKGARGVIHSFSATQAELEQILARKLYVGLNGIMTFTKDVKQLAAAKAVPRNRLLLETDAPFLTPHPHRGTICQPKHVRVTAAFLAKLRDESLEEFAAATTQNARELFGL